jgi:two-component system response regulator FixJ
MSEAASPSPTDDAASGTKLVVHVVDDDEAVRRSLALLLASFDHSTRTYGSAEELLAALDNAEPGCVIVDIRMPGMDGLALQQELRRRGANLPVVVVTGHAEVALAVRAMKAGAVDFIEKPYSEEDMLRAVSAALTRVADEQQQRAATEQATARIAALTPRERDVLRRLVDGWPNKVIAHELGISPRTVEIHRANVMEKLGCRSLAEAVRIALAAGFGEG